MARMTALEVGGWRITHRGGRVYLIDNHTDADPGMPPAVAQRLAVELFLASDRATWDEGESPGPAQVNATPAGPGATTSVQPTRAHRQREAVVPTLSHVQALASIGDAKTLIHKATPEFREMVEEAVSFLHGTTLREFSRNADLQAWRNVLTVAVEASAAGLSPPPAAGTQSGRGRAEQSSGNGEGRQDSATTPRPDNPKDGDDGR